jgi:glucose-6-phosphate 1-epimerase
MANDASQPSGASGTITTLAGDGGLPKLGIQTPWSTAEVYLHGAHVTQFKRVNEAPLLFLGRSSRFENGQPIRGGIPVIFPWFGPRDGAGLHGFARNHAWELKESNTASDGRVTLRFRMPRPAAAAGYPEFNVEYLVTVAETLSLEFMVTNQSADRPFEFEQCLHTYFHVEEIAEVEVRGLKGVSYLDKVDGFQKKTETADAIRISSEVDRVYLDTTGPVEIHDQGLRRVIRIEKENSASTVVWNPWIAKAKQMADFGDEEYRHMVCVESGNVGANRIVLPPGKTSSLKVRLISVPK